MTEDISKLPIADGKADETLYRLFGNGKDNGIMTQLTPTSTQSQVGGELEKKKEKDKDENSIRSYALYMLVFIISACITFSSYMYNIIEQKVGPNNARVVQLALFIVLLFLYKLYISLSTDKNK